MVTKYRTTIITILMLAAGAFSAKAPVLPYTLSLAQPEVFPPLVQEATGTDQDYGIFGRAMKFGQKERLWIFPREPFTRTSYYITSIDTSKNPSQTQIEYLAADELGISVNGGAPAITSYMNIFANPSTDKIKDLISLSFPPDHPYVFAGLINNGAYIYSFHPEDIDVTGVNSFELEEGEGLENIELTGMNDVQILKIQLRNGMTLLGFASGASDGPREMDIQFGIDEIKRITDTRRVRRVLLPTAGEITWPLKALIALYEGPGSPFQGQTLLGASPTGNLQTLALADIHNAAATPTNIYDTELVITDMAQSSIFYNKVVCGHSGEDDLISIVHLGFGGESAKIHHSIPQINSEMNFIIRGGIVHPFGTSGFLVMVYNSDTNPTSSEVHYINYPIESLTDGIMFGKVDIGQPSGMVTDVALFPRQGYAAFIGTGVNSGSGVASDFYIKAQIMCHPTCAACKGMSETQCTRCPPRLTLEAQGSSGMGMCVLEEEETNEDIEAPVIFATCGGEDIIGCVKCETAQPGFCQLCQKGFGLDEISERGTGQSCALCPVAGCMTCELTNSGKPSFFNNFFRKNLSKMHG